MKLFFGDKIRVFAPKKVRLEKKLKKDKKNI